MELSAAIFPLAIYFWILARRYAREKIVVVWGTSERFLIFCACLGMIIVGPLKFFFPMDAFAFWESINGAVIAWGLLITLGILVSFLISRHERISILLYPLDFTDAHALLRQECLQLDPQTEIAGNHFFVLPRAEMEFIAEYTPQTQCVSLNATHYKQNQESWQHLQRALKIAAPQLNSPQKSAKKISRRFRYLSLIFFLFAFASLIKDLLL